MNNNSTEFSWDKNAFSSLLESCKYDDAVNVSLRYIKNFGDENIKILEAGSGSGRVVKYLYDNGFQNIFGIELNQEAVDEFNKEFPKLHMMQGDILNMPFEKNSFDVVLSYGVVEHFPIGLADPMRTIYDILRPGGIAIITVPSVNLIRKTGNLLERIISPFDPRKNNYIRKLLKKEPFPKRNTTGFSYYVYPQFGNFFEYQLTPKQFEDACHLAEFEIIESLPIAHMDGLYHIFGKGLVKYEDYRFAPNALGNAINSLFKKIPFLHNHMHLCVLKK